MNAASPLPILFRQSSLRARDGLILHQTLYAAAKLGVADHPRKRAGTPPADLASRNYIISIII